MDDSRLYYKVFTHDLRSPMRGGAPVWGGALPVMLPTVPVDTSEEECGAGWNFCSEAWIAMTITGFWPNSHSVRVFEVRPETEVYHRGRKARAAAISIVRELSPSEVALAIRRFSEEFLRPFAEEMTAEQLLWFEALKRPYRDENVVKAALETAVMGVLNVQGAWYTYEVWEAWCTSAHITRAFALNTWNAWHAGSALIERFSVLNGWTTPTNINRAAVRKAYEYGAETVRLGSLNGAPTYTMVP